MTKATVPGWTPGADIYLALKDKTGEGRSAAEMEGLLSDLREAAERHGFALSQYGTAGGFARMLHATHDAEGRMRLP